MTTNNIFAIYTTADKSRRSRRLTVADHNQNWVERKNSIALVSDSGETIYQFRKATIDEIWYTVIEGGEIVKKVAPFTKRKRPDLPPTNNRMETKSAWAKLRFEYKIYKRLDRLGCFA